jgi:hypothetical protein
MKRGRQPGPQRLAGPDCKSDPGRPQTERPDLDARPQPRGGRWPPAQSLNPPCETDTGLPLYFSEPAVGLGRLTTAFSGSAEPDHDGTGLNGCQNAASAVTPGWQSHPTPGVPTRRAKRASASRRRRAGDGRSYRSTADNGWSADSSGSRARSPDHRTCRTGSCSTRQPQPMHSRARAAGLPGHRPRAICAYALRPLPNAGSSLPSIDGEAVKTGWRRAGRRGVQAPRALGFRLGAALGGGGAAAFASGR